jgi:hypothetical protein
MKPRQHALGARRPRLSPAPALVGFAGRKDFRVAQKAGADVDGVAASVVHLEFARLQCFGAVGQLPEGTGILIFGSDNVTVRNNTITGNDSFGIPAIGNPFFFFFDPRIEPFIDNLLVQGNTVTENGASSDPLRTFTPGADIVFLPDVFGTTTGTLLLPDPDPTDNCFTGNTFDVDFPPGLVGAFECL